MVDVSDKNITGRRALAVGTIRMNREAFSAITGGKVRKGDVLTVAQVAGIIGTKKTSDLIPMCHVLCLTNAKVTFELQPESCTVRAFCSVKTDGKTGVEMEALTGVTTALLTIYDMCKAIDKRMVIEDVHLIEKHGGRSGDFYYDSESVR
jgi:cyclic pyranopterin phosphate synthase